MEKVRIAKDKAVGKVLETTGKITNDQELEFTGKVRSMTAEVKDKVYDVKEDVLQEANELIDKINQKRKS